MPLFIVMSDLRARRTERRNRSVHKVHEDFEHRSTTPSNRAIDKKRHTSIVEAFLVYMTIRLFTGLLVIILVVIFRRIKL